MKQDRVRTDVLDIAYEEHGPSNGPPVILLHGFPYDVRAFDEVAPPLAADGCRVLVPWLRGYGPTRFLTASTLRSGEQAALGHDLLQFMDALGIRRAALAGYDWGGRAACVVAALKPERVRCLVSCAGYNIFRHRRLPRIRPPPRRSIATGTSTTSIPSAGGPASPRTAATSAICCGRCGRPNGASTRRPSRRRRRRSTIPTSSMS